MNIGIVIGLLTIMVALYLNYVNLYTFKDHNGDKVTHWLITYWLSWLIPFIPFIGLIIEIVWLISLYFINEYETSAKIFEET